MIIEHKGYIGNVYFSPEDNLWCGCLLGIKDLVCYHNENFLKMRCAFKKAVEDYLDLCKKHKDKPDYAEYNKYEYKGFMIFIYKEKEEYFVNFAESFEHDQIKALSLNTAKSLAEKTIDAYIEGARENTSVYSWDVREILALCEYCGCDVVDFGGNLIEPKIVNEKYLDELVSDIYCENNRIKIHTLIDEEKYIIKLFQKNETLQSFADKFSAKKCITQKDLEELKQNGIVALYSDANTSVFPNVEYCELGGAIRDEIYNKFDADTEMIFCISRDKGFIPFTKDSTNKITVTREDGIWRYHIAGLFNCCSFTIGDSGPRCEGKLFYIEDL